MKKNIKNTLLGIGLFAVTVTLINVIKKVYKSFKGTTVDTNNAKPLFEDKQVNAAKSHKGCNEQCEHAQECDCSDCCATDCCDCN